MPSDGSSGQSGYTACTSKPPMPPSFIKRISRSSSAFVTAGPNHHQRIMTLASSGGRANPRWSSVIVWAWTFAIRPPQTKISDAINPSRIVLTTEFTTLHPRQSFQLEQLSQNRPRYSQHGSMPRAFRKLNLCRDVFPVRPISGRDCAVVMLAILIEINDPSTTDPYSGWTFRPIIDGDRR